MLISYQCIVVLAFVSVLNQSVVLRHLVIRNTEKLPEFLSEFI